MDYLQFQSFRKYGNISHSIGTRQLGNVSFSVEDDLENVHKNRKKFAAYFGVSEENIVAPKLVHGNKVTLVDKRQIGEADAMISNHSKVVLMIPVADCAPIFIFDPKASAIGLIHAGWRGSLKNISQKTVQAMENNFNSKASDLVVGIGPCICVKHYEVGEAVLPGAKGHFDLRATNISQLLDAGVKRENIEIMDYCTYERTDMFYSYRAEGQTGRFATGIMIL